LKSSADFTEYGFTGDALEANLRFHSAEVTNYGDITVFVAFLPALTDTEVGSMPVAPGETRTFALYSQNGTDGLRAITMAPMVTPPSLLSGNPILTAVGIKGNFCSVHQSA